MLSNKERMDETAKLTLDRRKVILKTYFETCGYTPMGMTDMERDKLVQHLRSLGYYPPMFDFAFRLVLSEGDRVKT